MDDARYALTQSRKEWRERLARAQADAAEAQKIVAGLEKALADMDRKDRPVAVPEEPK